MKHATQIRIDFLNDGNFDEDKLVEVLSRALSEHGLEFLGYDLESMDHAYPEHLRNTIQFDTFPDMFTDYENLIENENYDNELIVFEVPRDWAINWIKTELGMSLEEFLNEYTWDDTLAMRYKADADGVLMNEHTEPR